MSIERTYGGKTADQRRTDRRERLLDAALELFGTVGFKAVSVERLCTLATVSTRHFYAEFGGREAVLRALYERINDDAAVALDQAWAGAVDLPLAERTEVLLRTYITSTSEDIRRARVAYVEIVGASPALEELRQRRRMQWLEVIDGIIQDAVRRGEVTPGNYRLTLLAFISAVNGLVHDALVPGHATLDEVLAELVRLLLARLHG